MIFEGIDMTEYIGQSVDKKHVEQAKKEILESDESLEGIFHCGIERSTSGGRGLTLHDYLIITNKRIIAWGRGLLSKNIESFDYSKITNVQMHQGILLGEIELNVFGAKEKFKSMVTKDVPIAKRMIDEYINKSKVSKGTGMLTVEERLEKLGQLLEKGLITKKEFEEQKKKILINL